MSSAIETRLTSIEKQLTEYNKKLLNAETLYQDETRMRRIIQEQFIPIITVSKENMITNCYKVEELKQTREEIEGVHQAIKQFQNNLEIIQEFEIRCDRLESDFHSELSRLRKDLAPNQQKQLNLHSKLDGLLSFQKEYKNDLQIREQRVCNLESQFLEHQEKMQKLLQKDFIENHKKIESLEKQISNVSNMAEISHVYFQKCKDQFEEINQALLKQEIEIMNIKMDLKEQLQGKIEQIFQNYINNNTQIIELFDKFKEIKNFMTEISAQASSQNSKFTELQQFLIYQQPIITQLQISDLFQEFLCIPDQMKLIEYDNHKFAQLKQFQTQKEFTQNQLNLKLPQNQKNQTCIQIFNQNIQTFLNTILQEQSGAIRINFSKDIHPDMIHIQRRAKEICQDLKLKANLTKRIYKFEKQVFIIQGKIKGDIVQTQDLLEEVHSRDKHDFLDGRKYDEQAQQDSLINLNDPNHKLKQQVKFINKDHLIQLYLENDRITRKRNEELMLANQQLVKNMQEEQQINETALQNRRQSRRNNNRQAQQQQENSQGSFNQIIQQNKSFNGSNNFQRPLFAQDQKFDSQSSLLPFIKPQVNDKNQSELSQDKKHEKSASSNSQNLFNNQIRIQQNQQIQMNQSISFKSLQKQELEELNMKMGLLQNVKITVNPDFHLLPETNICSRCAFKGQLLDVTKNNNHMLNIAPPRQVIYEMIFIKSEKKINRIHHRFLGKKRNWLTRQIDPAKRYLYMIEKNAKINQINSEGEIDLDAGSSLTLSKNILKEKSTDIENQIDRQDTKTAENQNEEVEKKIEVNFSAEKKKKNANQSFNSQIQEIDEKPKSATQSENQNLQKIRNKGPSLSVIQQLIQNELQKMKTVIEAQFQTKMSILNTTIMSKLQSFNVRLDTQGNSLTEFKHVTNKAMIKQYETLEKRMQSIELNQDYIEDQFKQKTKEYEELIDKQELHIIEFKDYINHELIQFYKNKKRVQTEIQSHSREYSTKFKVLADLNEEFSFKLSYIDKMLPIIVEQSKFIYSLLLQDINNRQKLAESLKTSQIQDNGYLLLEKLRSLKNLQSKDLDDEKLKDALFQVTQKLLFEQKNEKLGSSQINNNSENSSKIYEQSKQNNQQQNKFEISNLNQIPDKYIENQLKNSQGGLYLDVMNYRNQIIYSKKFEIYLEKMTEKLEILMDHVKPYKDFWTLKDNNIEDINILSNYHKTVSNENEDLIKSSLLLNSSQPQNINEKKDSKEELQLKRRKIFDDIHLGKLNEFIKDAYFVQKLDMNKICQLVSKQELDQSNLADKFLKEYLNEVNVNNNESSQDLNQDENLSQQQKYIRNILSIRAASAGQLMKNNLNYNQRQYQIQENNKDKTVYNIKSAQITKKNQTVLAQETLNDHNQSNVILTSNQSKRDTTFQQSSSQINIQTMWRNTPDNKKNNINIQNNKTSEMNSPADKNTDNKESQFQFNQLKEYSEFNILQLKQENQQIPYNKNKQEKKQINSQNIKKQTKVIEQNKINNKNIIKIAKNSQSALNLDRKTDSILNQDFERSQKLIRDLTNSNVLGLSAQNEIIQNTRKTVLVAKMLNGNTQPIHTNSNTDILQISQNNVQMSNQKHSIRNPKRSEMQSANIQNKNKKSINGAQDLIQFLNSSNSYNINRNRLNQTFVNDGTQQTVMLGDVKNNYQSQNQFMNHSLLHRNIPQNKRDHASTSISNQQINLVNSQLQQLLNMKNSQL